MPSLLVVHNLPVVGSIAAAQRSTNTHQRRARADRPGVFIAVRNSLECMAEHQQLERQQLRKRRRSLAQDNVESGQAGGGASLPAGSGQAVNPDGGELRPIECGPAFPRKSHCLFTAFLTASPPPLHALPTAFLTASH